ncbi:hypothetical protein A4X09_0g598 [Tilletia walkeri]|uniref:RRM domain-containing protein n=1 Tax=Tilletia walkeri TaxID=117179 RepID=A0A8X7T7J7_9BASI|nr:hypothetical protein A4X09_0g598 [Tilletia walkeri]
MAVTKEPKSKAKKISGSISSSVRKLDSPKAAPNLKSKAKEVSSPSSPPSKNSAPSSKTASTTTPQATATSKPQDPHAPTTARLHVSGLNPDVTEAEVRTRFTSFGEVLAVDGWPAGTNALGVPITYAFVTLRTTQGKLSRCLSLLNNSAWRGSKLRIGEARPLYSDRLSKEAQETVKTGWKAPTREESEAKFRLVEGGRTLTLDEVRSRPPVEDRILSSSSAGGTSSSVDEDGESSSDSDDSDSDTDSDSDDSSDDSEDGSDDATDETGDPALSATVAEDTAQTNGPEEEAEDVAEMAAEERQDGGLRDASENGDHEARVEVEDEDSNDDIVPDAASTHLGSTNEHPVPSQVRSQVQFNSLEQMFRVRPDLDEDAETNNFNLALDEDELADVEAQAQAGPSFSILGGLVLDDVEMDEDFAFGQVEGGSDAFLRTSDGAMGRLQETAQAATGSRSETTRTAFPFLFPRFEGITAGGGKGGSGAGVLEPVRDERNPAYQLLFRDSSEGVSPSSEMVPPFRRTETIDEIEERWKATRRDLTQEYKRRHREAVKKQRRRVVGSRATGGVVGMRATTRTRPG